MNALDAKNIKRAAFGEYLTAKREFVEGLCDWNHVEAMKTRHDAACDLVHDIAAGVDIAAKCGRCKDAGIAHLWSAYLRAFRDQVCVCRMS
jgi:hypothetical protein